MNDDDDNFNNDVSYATDNSQQSPPKSSPSSHTNAEAKSYAYKSLTIDSTLAEASLIGIPDAPPNLSLYPSLRGTFARDNGILKCRGMWAMTESAHSQPGQTSEFEFKLATVDPDKSKFPISGKYTGWFMLKQPMKSSIKVEDKELNIDFIKSENGDRSYKMTGTGVNKFGKFTLYGTLDADSSIQMFRVYSPKPTPKSARPGSTKLSISSPRPQTLPVAASPRDSTGRVRKPSAVLQASAESAAISTAPPVVKRQPVVEPKPPPVVIPPPAAAPTLNRTPRAPPFLVKCKDLLKDMSKYPQSLYFNDPVDHVALNIPDYPVIIKEPMDFGTIRKNLEKQVYKAHEEFADHMRLVFKNAITYNVRRDNPVHIAARELADLFEERYRLLVSHLQIYAAPTEQEIAIATATSKKGSLGKGRGSRGRGSGPRSDALPVLDSGAQAMRMMQQKLMEMEAEITSLRTAVRQADIKHTIGHQMVAAQAPLTYEEKKILISNIMKLDGDQMTTVVDIIQSAMPTTACGEGDEVEIPVDELDTYTLRQLQDYVQAALSAKSKKRPSVPPSPAAGVKRTNPPKRARSNSNKPIPVPVPEFPPPPPQPLERPPPSSFTSSTPLSETSHPPPAPASQIDTDADDGDTYDSYQRKRGDSFEDMLLSSQEYLSGQDGFEEVANLDAWRTNNPSRAASQNSAPPAAAPSSSWGDAVTERNMSESRRSILKAEEDQLNEQKSRVERERAAERAAQRATFETNDDALEQKSKLDLLREQERVSREDLQPSVQIDQAQYNDVYDV